ncbi:MAG: hypothetical protein ABW221_06285 [Vicinamibacteria bacterium]
MIWLGRTRGHATDWVTQLWVRATGREMALSDAPWLDGPVGDTRRIGGECFRELASSERLRLEEDAASVRGIVPDLACLTGPTLDIAALSPGVRRFYEQTSAYELDAWAEWCGAFRTFGRLLAVLFSRRLQQLNIPLSALDTSRGMTNAVWHLREPDSGRLRYAAWVRHMVGSGTTIYAGSYGPCRLPDWPDMCLKVVFPLPNGNALVIMKPVVHDDGSLSLVSSGNRFGEPGFYFTVRRGGGRLAARRVGTMRETIRVYESGPSDVRADHTLTIFGLVFCRLHYRLRDLRAGHGAAVPAQSGG